MNVDLWTLQDLLKTAYRARPSQPEFTASAHKVAELVKNADPEGVGMIVLTVGEMWKGHTDSRHFVSAVREHWSGFDDRMKACQAVMLKMSKAFTAGDLKLPTFPPRES